MSKRLFPMNNLCRYSSCHPPSVWLSLGYILYNIGIPFEPIQNITHRVTDVFYRLYIDSQVYYFEQ